ncbi:hypothetical protein HK102_006481, partial [Quaeritorhiza haematococci]
HRSSKGKKITANSSGSASTNKPEKSFERTSTSKTEKSSGHASAVKSDKSHGRDSTNKPGKSSGPASTVKSEEREALLREIEHLKQKNGDLTKRGNDLKQENQRIAQEIEERKEPTTDTKDGPK